MGKKPLKPFTIAAFDIGPSSLKFVEMLRDERRVLTAGVFPLAPGRWRDHGHLSAQIRSAIDTTAEGQITRLIASVPLGNAHLRVVSVPDGDPAGVRDDVVWDMAHYLARPLELYALDVAPLPAPSSGSPTAAAPALDDDVTRVTRVLVGAFRRDEALALRDTLESATGLSLAALDVDGAAIINAFSFNYPEHAANRAVLIQANENATAVIRTRGGGFEGAFVLRDTGDSLRPGADAQERAEGLLRCVRGIAAALRNAEEGWEDPDHVLLCGELAVNADFRELLRTHLPTGFALLNPFRNLPGPNPDDHPAVYPGAPLAAATGLALRLAEET
jgi:Tfp pilus assembly PilM family ATPase